MFFLFLQVMAHEIYWCDKIYFFGLEVNQENDILSLLGHDF